MRLVHSGKKENASENHGAFGGTFSYEILSAHEIEVLQQIARGNRNRDIAERLFIADDTVKAHIKHLMEKLGANDRTEAVAIGLRLASFSSEDENPAGQPMHLVLGTAIALLLGFLTPLVSAIAASSGVAMVLVWFPSPAHNLVPGTTGVRCCNKVASLRVPWRRSVLAGCQTVWPA